MKTLYIMRGISGSGKSTVVRQLSEKLTSYAICSADTFMYNKHGQYEFSFDKLKECHEKCFERFREAMSKDIENIFIDNTNTSRKEFGAYDKEARDNKYAVVEIIVGSPWIKKGNNAVLNDNYLKKCHKNNVHNVPFETILKQANRFPKPQ